MSDNLSLGTVSPSQANKTVTINGIVAAIDAALSEYHAVDTTALPVTVAKATMQQAMVLAFSGHTAAGIVNLAAMKRVIALRNLGSYDLTVNVGTGSITVKAGTNTLAILDGTANGIAALSASGAASGVPAGGTTGQVLTKQSATDGDVAWATPSSGGGGGSGDTPDALASSIHKPTLASFARQLNNSTGVTFSDTTRGVYIEQSPNVNGMQACLAKDIPAAPYTITAMARLCGLPASFCHWGIGHLDSSNTKNTIILAGGSSSGAQNRFDLQDCVSLGVYGADTSIASFVSTPSATQPMWFKIQDDGTNFVYYFSLDGEHWHKLSTRSRTAYLTPTQCGVFLGSFQPQITTINVGVHCFSFNVAAGLS